MRYKSLEDTFIYKFMNHGNVMSNNILKILNSGLQLKSSHIEEQLLRIKKNFKYPLKYKILEEFENEDIILMYSPKNVSIVSSIPFFLTKNNSGRVVAVVVVDLFSTFDEKNNVIDIDAKKLYTLMEGAYFAKMYFQFTKQIVTRSTVIKNGSEIYSAIITRVLNKKYALNLDKNKLNNVIYLTSKFYLVNVLGLEDNEMTKNYALANCTNANPFTLEEVDKSFNPDGFKDFGSFIKALDDKDMNLKLKDLQVRTFLEAFINMYDATMLLALESFPYFLFNILSVNNGAYFNNQYILEDIVDIKGAKIYADLSSVSK